MRCCDNEYGGCGSLVASKHFYDARHGFASRVKRARAMGSILAKKPVQAPAAGAEVLFFKLEIPDTVKWEPR